MTDEGPFLFPPEELPQTDEPKKRKETGNCLSTVMTEKMEELGLELPAVSAETNIPRSTLHDWKTGKVKVQVTDKRLLELAKCLKTTLEYLLYGVGEEVRPFKTIQEIGNE